MEIAESIKDILVEDIFVEIPAARMNEDDSLRDVFGLDSLGFVELRIQCQNRFGVTISDQDFTPDNFATIANLTRLVTRLHPAISGASKTVTAS